MTSKVCSKYYLNPNQAEPEPKKELITKTRKHEKRQIKFRAFKISCFRDENILS